MAKAIAAVTPAEAIGSTTRSTAAVRLTRIDRLPANTVAQVEEPPHPTARLMRVRIRRMVGIEDNPARAPAKGKWVGNSLVRTTAVLEAQIVHPPQVAEIAAVIEVLPRVQARGPVV